MRSLRSFGNSCWIAVVALALPIAQSHAQECAKADGLNVCPIGKAQLKQVEDGVELHNLGETGRDGAAISVGQATDWTAHYETASTDDAQQTTFTAVSDGAPISTTTARKVGDAREVSATFSGSGADTTYTLQAYRQGELQAEVRGIQSGQRAFLTLARAVGSSPSCRGYRQTVMACIAECQRSGFGSCTYCDIECPRAIGFHNVRDAAHYAACRWVVGQPTSTVVLSDGSTVDADQLVMTEEVRGAGSYPYLNFEKILFQASGGTAHLGSQTVSESK